MSSSSSSLVDPLAAYARTLQDRCIRAHGWGQDVASRVFECYRQFMELKGVFEDWDGTTLSPTPYVDVMWHQHLLDNRHYSECCRSAFGGRVVYHNPEGGLDRAAREDRLRTTEVALKARFGAGKLDRMVWNFTSPAADAEDDDDGDDKAEVKASRASSSRKHSVSSSSSSSSAAMAEPASKRGRRGFAGVADDDDEDGDSSSSHGSDTMDEKRGIRVLWKEAYGGGEEPRGVLVVLKEVDLYHPGDLYQFVAKLNSVNWEDIQLSYEDRQGSIIELTKRRGQNLSQLPDCCKRLICTYYDPEDPIKVEIRDLLDDTVEHHEIRRSDWFHELYKSYADRRGVPLVSIALHHAEAPNSPLDPFETCRCREWYSNIQLTCRGGNWSKSRIQACLGCNKSLTVRVKDGNGEESMFKMKKSTILFEVMKAFAERKGLGPQTLRYLLDGDRIHPYTTPAMLDLEDGDQIDAILEQCGC